MRVIDGDELGQLIHTRLARAAKASFAIAFWGKGAVGHFNLTGQADVQIICNLDMGGTNPFEIEKIIEGGASVWSLPTLHAKFGIIDDVAFLGSSNASTNGLGLEGKRSSGWQELNVATSDPALVADLRRRYDVLKSLAGPRLQLGDAALEHAKAQWKIRQNAIGSMTRGHGQLSALIVGDPSFADGRQLFLVAYLLETDPNFVEQINYGTAEAQERFGIEFDIYMNCTLPQQGIFIDFRIRNTGRASFTGFWERRAAEDFSSADNNYQVAKRVDTAHGYELGDRRRWSRLAAAAWRDHGAATPDSPLCVAWP